MNIIFEQSPTNPNQFSKLSINSNSMLSEHYPSKEMVVAHRNSYDKLESHFTKDDVIVAFSSMQNIKSCGVDGVPCEFYKIM